MEDTKIMEFSVSMCVYGKDNPDYFKIAVDSILNQTVEPSEVVLVVDGPVPNKLNEIISEYEKSEIFNVIRLDKNMGHGNARRIGLENCKYDLVALMDADDISVSDRFEKQLEIFKNDSHITIVGGNLAEFINNSDNIISHRNVPEHDNEIKLFLKKRCPMNQQTVMFKKKDVQLVGGYIDWFCNEDYYLWIRLCLSNMQFYNIQADLVYFRTDENMYKRRGGWKYFQSEAKLQSYMMKKKIIAFPLFVTNVFKRLVVQVILPNKIRGWVFKKFAREN